MNSRSPLNPAPSMNRGQAAGRAQAPRPAQAQAMSRAATGWRPPRAGLFARFDEGLHQTLGRNVASVTGLAAIAFAAALAASLATWSIQDPSFSNATSGPARNALGFIGAALSDLFMQLFGFASMALIVPLVVWGWRLMSGSGGEITRRRLALGIGGALMVSGFLAAIHPPAGWPLPVGLGGVTGDVLFKIPSAFSSNEPVVKMIAIALFGVSAAIGLIASFGPRRTHEVPAEQMAHPASAARAAEPQVDDGEDDGDGFGARLIGALQHWMLTARSGLSRRTGIGRRGPAEFGAGFNGRMGGWLDEQDEGYDLRRQPPPPPQEADYDPRPRQDYRPAQAPAPATFQPSRRAEPAMAPLPPAAAAPHYADEDDYEAEMAPPAPQPERIRTRYPVAPVPMTGTSRATATVVMPKPVMAPELDDGDDEDVPPFSGSTRVAHGRGSISVRSPAREPERIEPPMHAPEPDYDDEPEHEPEPAFTRTSQRMAEPEPPREIPREPVTRQAAIRSVHSAAPLGMGNDERRVAVAPGPKPLEQSKRPPHEVNPRGRVDGGYEFPSLALLSEPKRIGKDQTMSVEQMQRNAGDLEGVLEDFGIKGEIINVRPGPVVTLYELEPAAGIKSSRVIGLADDIARSMCAVSARVAVVPGRNVIGIELPNQTRETVFLRELANSSEFATSNQKLALCMGKTIGGEPVIADLARMPHLLVAGTTGSGKSVAINTMILSLLYRLTPQQCKLIMIDPKMLELSVYDGIPHLLSPVVTDPKKAVVALKWTVREMEDRYKKMSKLGVRNIDGFNARVAEAQAHGESLSRMIQTGFDRETGEPIYEQEELALSPLPYIVVIVDEMADLMMVAGKEIEGAIQRLAQMARAAGIHIVMATQRPSVDVITGTIKANFPTRISFQVTSKIDSRTILGEQGAEQLLGQGDMLYMAGGGRIQRVHGPFVSDGEVEKIVAHLKTQGAPDYLDAITRDEDEDGDGEGGGGMAGLDNMDDSADLYDKAVAVVLRDRKASTSYVQRRLQIGYNRAASLIERMEKEGIVGPANHAGKREILVGSDDEYNG